MRGVSIKCCLFCFFVINLLHAQANKHGLPFEVLSWDINMAYPGIEYNYQLGVRGGSFPYRFVLKEKPLGMTIDSLKGIIVWTPSSNSNNNQVSVVIIDSKGKTINHTFTINVTTVGFYFVSNSGNNSNKGTKDSPWATLAYASEKAGSESYVYVRNGKYSEAMTLNSTSCGKFLVYPGEVATVIGIGSGKSSFNIKRSKTLFQGFNFDANDHRWLFSVEASLATDLMWCQNKMFNVYSNDWENPAFIFFWDGSQTPMKGEVHYKNVVIQNNTMYDLENPNDHGGCITCYDVQDMLFADNTVYKINGFGVQDKDDGFRNTFRNNVIYDCGSGISLTSQDQQGSIEVCYNLVYNCNNAINVGWQPEPSFLKDTYIHHNTFLGSVNFKDVLDGENSTNINIYNNIIGNNKSIPYKIYPVENGSGQYRYPEWFTNVSRILIDSNLIWAPSNGNIAGYSWGIPYIKWDAWQNQGFDKRSLNKDPLLNDKNALSPNSPYYGFYGRDGMYTSLPVFDPSPIDTTSTSIDTTLPCTPDTITIRDTVKVTIHDTVKVTIRDTVKITIRDTVKITIRDTVKVTIRDTVSIDKIPSWLLYYDVVIPIKDLNKEPIINK